MDFKKLVSASALMMIVAGLLAGTAYGINTRIHRHTGAQDFLAGTTDNVVISSRGTIELGIDSEVLADDFDDVWAINSVVASGSTVYLGTSPNGGVYKYRLGQLSRIYPVDNPGDDEFLTNEHIFAMTADISGRLLVGISGDNCRVVRFEDDQPEVVFEPDQAGYIFAMTTGPDGSIFLGTGPEGKIYKLDPMAGDAQVLYDSEDNNILSLATDEQGMLYAGSDTAGLVYMIDPARGQVRVLYDSSRPEITALVISDGRLYAAGTNAAVQEAEQVFSMTQTGPGRPDVEGDEPGPARQIQVPNAAPGQGRPQPRQGQGRAAQQQQEMASTIYSVTTQGFVRDIFRESAVFLSMAEYRGRLLVGTGNQGQIFSVDPAAQQKRIIYDDKEASQITAMAIGQDGIYVGTSNPARLVKLGDDYAGQGVYDSPLIDAGQPAQWGRLRIEGDLGSDCRVLVSARTGNVNDADSSTFSPWTEPVEIEDLAELEVPLGRFLQYRLTLSCPGRDHSPVIRQVAVSGVVPNLAPQVTSVEAARAEPPRSAVVNVSWEAEDANDDKLIYSVEYRRPDWGVWVSAAEQIEETTFEWDTRTVADGRYELRITANDIRDNSPETALQASRISELIVVDNTPPEIEVVNVDEGSGAARIEFIVRDELSIIGQVDYTVNSDSEWMGVLPEQLVMDSRSEQFAIELADLEPGKHVVSIRAADDVGNTRYHSLIVTLR